MKDVYINGIGIISKCAQTKSSLCSIAANELKDYGVSNCKIDFTSSVTHTQLRRASRYSKLAVGAASLAVQDASFLQNIDKNDAGTVLSTGYGAVESITQFMETCLRFGPAKCSPIVFAGTVPNSAVGQICMVYGFKGASTLLTGGDPLEYASLLLHTNKAKAVLAGSVEEYNEDLVSALRREGALKNAELSEGAAMVVLSAEKLADSYCRITAFANTGLTFLPYIHAPDKKEKELTEQKMVEVLSSLNASPSIVLTSSNGGALDEIEERAVRQVFGKTVPCVPYKRFFGECLGAGYMQGVVLGAAGIQSGVYKSKVCVTGIDSQGNYMAVILEEL